jgi:hypothetical protein
VDASVVDAYVKGRLAGANHSRAKQLDSSVETPDNPYPSSSYLACVEWDRGFNDGFEQARRSAIRVRTVNAESQTAA